MKGKGVAAEKTDLKTTTKWEKSIGGKEAGYPLIENNQCYMTFYGNNQIQVLAINLINGEQIWQTSLPYYKDVLPLTSDGQRIFVQTNSSYRGNVFTLNRTSGNIEWTFKGKVLILSKHFPFIFNRAELLTSEIATSQKDVFIPLGASRLLALNAETGEKRWEISLGWRYAPVKMDLIDNLIYWKVGGDFFKVIDAKSGEEANSPLPEPVTSQIIKPDSVYCIDKQRLFLRIKKDTKDQIVCFDLTTGEKIWNVMEDFLFPIKCEDNNLYAYGKHRGKIFGAFDTKYSLISIDKQTGKISWSVSSKLISFIQKKGNYILINHEKNDSQLIAAEDGTILWDSKDFSEKRNIKGKVSCIMDENGASMFLIIGDRLFCIKINTDSM
ncbi:MAG: PQQ-binding-like beta-propeller repeat protein [bacterium]